MASIHQDAILAADVIPVQTASGIPGAVQAISGVLFKISAVALVAAAAVLTFGVIVGHVSDSTLLWQDEVSIFLVAGAMFLSAAAVQGRRGHIGIDLLSHYLSPGADAVRRQIVDALVLFFCIFFAWKSGELLHEAFIEQHTSHSAWGPPMWIPYLLLTIGMVVLALQVAVQVGEKSLATLAIVGCGVIAFLLWHRPLLPFVTGVPQWVISISYCVVTLLVMLSGIPIAFALGVVALAFMVGFMPGASLDTVAQNVYEEMASIIILSIPLFILKGAAIGRSGAARTSTRRCTPGCTASPAASASPTSSPARCSPPWRARPRPPVRPSARPAFRRCASAATPAASPPGIIAAGGTLGILLPPSITMILYAVAAEQSLGRLFLAGIGPGLLLVTLFAIYAVYPLPLGIRGRKALYERPARRRRS